MFTYLGSVIQTNSACQDFTKKYCAGKTGRSIWTERKTGGFWTIPNLDHNNNRYLKNNGTRSLTTRDKWTAIKWRKAHCSGMLELDSTHHRAFPHPSTRYQGRSDWQLVKKEAGLRAQCEPSLHSDQGKLQGWSDHMRNSDSLFTKRLTFYGIANEHRS